MANPVDGPLVIASVEALAETIGRLSAGGDRWVVGIDGLDGVGKTTLGRELARLIAGTLVSLDEYLVKKMGRYVRYIDCHRLNETLALSRPPIIVEGVCFREVESWCGFCADFRIYVRTIAVSGIWHSDEICLALRPPDELKQRERSLQSAFDRNKGAELGLIEELIDYHATYLPVSQADLIFEIEER